MVRSSTWHKFTCGSNMTTGYLIDVYKIALFFCHLVPAGCKNLSRDTRCYPRHGFTKELLRKLTIELFDSCPNS